MSMPRVGSSRIRISGSVISHRASSTFCWLPPERLRISAVGSAGRMSSALMYSLDQLGARGLRDRPQPAARGLQREEHVVGHGEVADDALGLAVLAGEGDLAVDRVPRAAQPAPLGADRELAGVGGVGAEEQPGQLGAARSPSRPARPIDLALVELEVGGLQGALAAQAERLEHRRPGLVRRRGARPRGRAGRATSSSRPIISLTSSSWVVSATIRSSTRRAVAQDRHPVGDLVDLVEEVGDEHDRDALRRAAGASPRTAWPPRRRPGWRWARRGSAPCLDVHGAGDGDQLLDRDRVLAEHGGRVDVDAEALERRPRPDGSSPGR